MKARIALGVLALGLLALIVCWEPLFGRKPTGQGDPVQHAEQPAEPPPVLRGHGASTEDAAREDPERPAPVAAERVTGLEGRVVTAEGEAVPAVPVLVLNSWIPPVEVAEVRTDAEGRFRVEGLTPGRVQAFVAGGGWVTEQGRAEGIRGPTLASVEVLEGSFAQILLRVVPAAAAFGRITDDEGRPVAGAEVRACAALPSQGGLGALFGPLAPSGRVPLGRTEADEHGAYRLHGLEDGEEYVLEARTAEHLPTRSAAFRALRASARQVDLVVRAGRLIEVTVRTTEGRPIPGVRVFGHEQRGGLTLLGRGGRKASTDAAGRARLGPFAPAPVEVSVHVFGFVTDSETDDPPRVVPADQDEIEIRLDRGRTITGRLFDAEGRPVAGATVQAQQREVSDFGYSITGLEAGETAADGCFEIVGLPEGPLTLVARTHRPPIRETTLLVESGSRDVRMAFGSDSARGLELVILDPEGRPVPRVRVEYGVFAPREVVGGRTHLVHVEERVRRRFSRGTAIRVFDARDAAGNRLPLAETTVTWRAGDPRVLEVRLQAEKVIRGRVVGPTGGNLGGVAVVAALLNGSDPRTVQTASDGSFEFRALGPTTRSLTANVAGDLIPPSSMEVVPSHDSVVLHVRAGVRPLLRVLDSRGEPVADATVDVSAREDSTLGGDLARAFGLGHSTLADGTLRLPVLDPLVSLRLRVEPPDDRLDLGRLEVNPWRPQDEELRLPVALTITGIVRDLDGRPVPQAAVHVAVPGQSPRAVWADEAGAFVVGDLRAGPVRLRARLPVEWVTGEMIDIGPEVEVQAGARDVVLEGAVGEVFTVVLEETGTKHDVPSAVLVPEDADAPRSVHRGEVQRDGRFLFHGLKRGRAYTLWIPPTTDDPDACVLKTGVRAPGDVLRVRRESGRTLEGRLEGPTGVRFLAVRVECGLIRHEGEVEDDGSFIVRGLPDLPWVLWAWGVGPKRAWTGEAPVRWDAPQVIELEATEDD